MKAAIYKRYGSADVVTIKEVAKPSPSENEALLKIHASTVNRTDSGFRSANYFISRFWSGLFRPKYPILGCEFSGVVAEVGSSFKDLKIGDRIFGYNDQEFGGHAEYRILKSGDCFAHIPENLDFTHAAALTEGAHYALSAIRAPKVTPGNTVLVYGATGAIGSAAVQLLRYFEAEIIAVSNTKNLDLVRKLGASEVIDYQTSDFTQTAHRFDFIFDAVGKSSFRACKPLLKSPGIYISTELGKGGANVWLALAKPLLGSKNVLFPLPTISKADLEFLRTLAEAGTFKPVLDREYPLAEIVAAHRYVDTGQKTGNVVVILP